MTPEDSLRLDSCLQEVAEILYRQTSTTELKNFESIEKTVRKQILQEVSPKIAFFIKKVTGTEKGRIRTIKSIVGQVKVTNKQATRLELKPYSQLSPCFEKNCLLLSGNESFQNGEKDMEPLTGMKVSHSTLQRLVQRQDYQLLSTKQGISEISVDGGKVRLRSGIKGMESYWQDYKAVRLQGIYYGAFLQDTAILIMKKGREKL